MSRLDQHIDAVRTRFLIQKLAHYAAWTIAGVCAALFVLIVLSRIFAFAIPPMLLLVTGALALVSLISLILAAATSPSRHATAVKIDEVLGLKERYSTALYARGNRDEFAQAAVSDAEHTANMTSIRKRFPMQMPRMGYPAMGAVLAVALVNRYLPQFDLFGREEAARQRIVQKQKEEQAREAVEKALVEVNSIPKVSGEAKALQAARRELDELLKNPIADPTEASVTAQRAIQAAEAARQRIEDVKTTADRFEQADIFRPLTSAQTGGFFEDFKKSVTETKFDKAATDMKAAVDKFNKADAATQEKMASEMKQMAEQLAKIANDPAVQGQVQKQLEQAGATPEQAKQMVREMERAASGDRAAQQRVKDMSENLARKMNGGVLPAPQELATFMQKMQQAQAKMQAQDSAAQMSQAANKMAQAMQNASAQNKAQANQQGQQANQQGGKQGGQQQQGQQGNQGQQQQQANAQQQGQQGSQQQQQGGGQSNQQQSGQGQQQTASQQGKQGAGDQEQGNPGQSQMADAQQQMNDALNDAQGKQDDTGGSAAGNDGMGEGEGEGGQWDSGQAQGQGGQQAGQGMGQGFSGPNNGGIGSGERPGKKASPFTFKKEVDKGEMDEKGKVLSSSFVKADSIRGESKEQLKQIIQSAQKDAADDIDRDRVPMQAQDVVRKYFDSVQQDLK